MTADRRRRSSALPACACHAGARWRRRPGACRRCSRSPARAAAADDQDLREQPVPLQRDAAGRLPPRRGPRHARCRLLAPSSTRRRARRPAPPPRWCWRWAPSTVPTTPARRPPTWRSATTRRSFKEELPEAVCGEADNGARQDRATARQVVEDGASRVHGRRRLSRRSSSWQLGERRATVRFLITPGMRYRLMARAPTEDFEKQQGDHRRLLRELPRPAARAEHEPWARR